MVSMVGMAAFGGTGAATAAPWAWPNLGFSSSNTPATPPTGERREAFSLEWYLPSDPQNELTYVIEAAGTKNGSTCADGGASSASLRFTLRPGAPLDYANRTYSFSPNSSGTCGLVSSSYTWVTTIRVFVGRTEFQDTTSVSEQLVTTLSTLRGDNTLEWNQRNYNGDKGQLFLIDRTQTGLTLRVQPSALPKS